MSGTAMPIDGLTLLAAGLSGFLGSIHCALMCGGIATGFAATSPNGGWAQAVQINLGRVAGYMLAGLAVGVIGSGVLQWLRIDALALVSRMLAGLVLVVIALRLLDGRGRFNLLARPGARLWRLLQPLQRGLLPANTATRRLALGMLWGWLPCGLSMSLLTVAWLQANVRDAVLTMAVFGLATLPMMVPLTWSGQRLGRWLQDPFWRRTGACLVLLAGLLTLLAPWLVQVPAMHDILRALGCRTLPG